MSKQVRKRKHDLEDLQGITWKNKFKPIDDEAQSEEEKLTKILFGGASNFLQSLEEAEKEPNASSSAIDSGVGETESDESDKERKPVWHDEEDDGIDVREALSIQGRRLPKGGENRKGNRYTNLLKHKFTSLYGTPAWANLKNKRDDSDSDDDILQTSGFVKKTPKLHLSHGLLESKKVKNLNREMGNEGPYINAVEFHPTSSVALVGGSSGIATLYAVDSKRNNKLHSIEFQKFPIRCARFGVNGNEAFLGSTQRHMYVYDLMSAKGIKIRLPDEISQAKKFIISPDGKYIVICNAMEIHVLSTLTKEKLFTLTQNSDVSAMVFNPEGSLLFANSITGEITVFDMNTRRVINKWQDVGCLKGTTIDISQSNQFLATGSGEGIVNLYDMETIASQQSPQPRKSILNLTTPINHLKFNPSSEILTLSSQNIKNAIRMFHLGSQTVFSNFPIPQMKLGMVNTFNYSPGSGFFAIGNCNSCVPLFRLKHYNTY